METISNHADVFASYREVESAVRECPAIVVAYIALYCDESESSEEIGEINEERFLKVTELRPVARGIISSIPVS